MGARIARHHRLFARAQRLIPARAQRLIPLIGLIGIVTSSCTLDSVIAAAGLPGTTVDAKVGPATVRGSYLDAWVDAGGFEYRFFFPNEPVCQALLARPDGLHFVWLGTLGRITNGEQRCDAVGVLSLQAWRDRQPRLSREPLPRAPARYRVVYRDPDLVQLHGRFPLAAQLGFTGTQRLIIVLPNQGACRRFVDRGTASMEYRASGPDALTLISQDELCPVLGLAHPPSQSPRS